MSTQKKLKIAVFYSVEIEEESEPVAVSRAAYHVPGNAIGLEIRSCGEVREPLAPEEQHASMLGQLASAPKPTVNEIMSGNSTVDDDIPF